MAEFANSWSKVLRLGQNQSLWRETLPRVKCEVFLSHKEICEMSVLRAKRPLVCWFASCNRVVDCGVFDGVLAKFNTFSALCILAYLSNYQLEGIENVGRFDRNHSPAFRNRGSGIFMRDYNFRIPKPLGYQRTRKDGAMLSDRADLSATTEDSGMIYVAFSAVEWELLCRVMTRAGAPSVKDWIMAEVRIRLKGIVSTIGPVPDGDSEGGSDDAT